MGGGILQFLWKPSEINSRAHVGLIYFDTGVVSGKNL